MEHYYFEVEDKKYEVLSFTKNTPVKETTVEFCYTFDGWYSESSFKHKVIQIENGLFDDITLYAKWIINQYQVTIINSDNTLATFTDISGIYDYNQELTVF